MKTYILTRLENDYNQHGAYFVAWFSEKPTLQELISMFYGKMMTVTDLTDDQILLMAHILKGGGRQNIEDTWYRLSEIEEKIDSGRINRY